MAIKAEDINLLTFLEKVAPTAFPEAGKLTLSNFEFLQIASLLKIEMAINKLGQKIR